MPAAAFQMDRLLSRPPKMKKFKAVSLNDYPSHASVKSLGANLQILDDEREVHIRHGIHSPSNCAAEGDRFCKDVARYRPSRNKIISFVDPEVQEDDQARCCLHRLLYMGCTSPIVLKEGGFPPPSVVAFFMLAHICYQARARVEYRLRGGV